MISYHNFSLRNKLITISMLTAAFTLLLTCFAFLIFETIRGKNSEIDKLSSIGNIIALHSGATLSFNDKKTATETLADLRVEPTVLYACIYDINKSVFADYSRSAGGSNDKKSLGKPAEQQVQPAQFTNKKQKLFQRNGIHLLLPIIVSEEQIGSLYIHAGLDQLYNRLYTYLAVILAISFVATFIAFFLSAKLQKSISIPIQKLTDIMTKVSTSKEYNLQVVPPKGSNEITLLYQGFNRMLGEIETRDRSLLLTQYSMDHASDGICWVTKDGSISSASLGACKLLGFSRDALLHLSIFQIWDNLSQQEWSQFWNKTSNAAKVHFSAQMLPNKNVAIPVEGTAHAIELDRKLCCILFRNVSQRKELEMKLQQAEKLEAVGTLAATVAHDLNNILSGITSYPEVLLLDLPEDSELRRPLQVIEQSGLKAAAIVQDMLTLSRRNNMITKSVNLNLTILEYLHSPEYKKMLEFHPLVEIQTELANDLHCIAASPVHITKCIMNLTANGVESMVTGGDLIIRTENVFLEDPLHGYKSVNKGEYVQLQITDFGVGISADDLRQIYDPFYTRKKMGRSGSGLGMTIVWNSVVDHKGYITVESKEGSGTCFSLYFPADLNQCTETQAGTTDLEDCMGTESVLVIDDSAGQRTVASAMLTKLGYVVSTVASGQEAVDHLKRHETDMLLLDMIMPPGMDGLDTYREIIKTYPQQKVVIASGFAENTRVKKLQKLGGGIFIKKPYNLLELGGAIRQELARSS